MCGGLSKAPPRPRPPAWWSALSAAGPPCPQVDLDALRELSWNGIPLDLRPDVWRLLSGYLPPAK